MSISTSNDPVQAVLDILNNSVGADWGNTGAKPSIIERQEESDQQYKSNNTADAIYVYPASDRSFTQQGFDWDAYVDFQRISCDIWTVGNASTERWDRAEDLAIDTREILLEYVNDNQSQTVFGRFQPVSETDLRLETNPNAGDHARKVVDFRVQVLR